MSVSKLPLKSKSLHEGSGLCNHCIDLLKSVKIDGSDMKPTEETSVSLIGKDISYIQKDIAEIKQTVKDLAGVYATKAAVEEYTKATDLRLKSLEQENRLWQWLSPTLSAAAASIMTFFIVEYFK